ncbi:MAG: HAD family hydrolase [Pseudomonadota bacterium]
MLDQAALPDPVATPLGFFAPFGEDVEDRVALCSAKADAIADRLDAAMAASGASVLSLDVFDTLLLRSDRSEAGRFWDMAEAASAEGLGAGPEDVLLARVQATALCYRTAEKSGLYGEAHIRDIYRQMGVLLARDDAPSVLARVEREVETANLHRNDALAELITRCAARGQRVMLLTDMYLGAEDVARLVTALCGGDLPIAALRSSADLHHSKRSGTAFSPAAEALGVATQEIFHIGDNVESDVAAARAVGCHALHFPILRAERRRRSADLERTIVALQKRGIRTDGWAKV